MSYKVSAPGSLMLLGEHAVLHGKQALVCAVDKRITVTLTPRDDQRIEIHSPLHGHIATDIAHLHIEKPFQFVLATLKHVEAKLKRGCDIQIESEFSDQVGLGSSAAVTVATLAALFSWLNIHLYPIDLVRQARNIIRTVQCMGSGADVAASVFGGMVGYSAQPLLAEKMTLTHPLTVIYAGFKTATPAVVASVEERFAQYPAIFKHLTNCIGECAQQGIFYARKGEWQKLGNIMNMQQGLMAALGVNTPLMQAVVDDLRKQEGIVGAKMSGAGLGDCLVGLGELPPHYQFSDLQRIPVAMSLQGVHCEKI